VSLEDKAKMAELRRQMRNDSLVFWSTVWIAAILVVLGGFFGLAALLR
jgi:hypothetical protein